MRWLMMLLLAGACAKPAQVVREQDVTSSSGHEHAHSHGHHDHGGTSGPSGEGKGYHHRFDDVNKWSQVFDDPARDAWQKPVEVIAALQLRDGASIADLGAGTGYFVMPIAKQLPNGKVYGVDIEPNMVAHMRERAKALGLANVVAVLAERDDAKLPDAVDCILVVDTYHHIDARPAYFAKLSQSLRPGGKLAVIDFLPDAPMGPPKAHRIPADAVKSELAGAGFAVAAEHRFLPHQYFIVFSRK